MTIKKATLEELREMKNRGEIESPRPNAKPEKLPDGFWDNAKVKNPTKEKEMTKNDEKKKVKAFVRLSCEIAKCYNDFDNCEANAGEVIISLLNDFWPIKGAHGDVSEEFQEYSAKKHWEIASIVAKELRKGRKTKLSNISETKKLLLMRKDIANRLESFAEGKTIV